MNQLWDDSGHSSPHPPTWEMLESIVYDESVNIDALLPKRRQILNRLSDDSGHTAPHPSTKEMLESIVDENISLAKESKLTDEDPGKPA